MFFDEIAKIEAHESEVLCVEFTPTESGNDMKKLNKYRDATTGFPRNDVRGMSAKNSMLMTCQYPDLGGASDWFTQISWHNQ